MEIKGHGKLTSPSDLKTSKLLSKVIFTLLEFDITKSDNSEEVISSVISNKKIVRLIVSKILPYI